MVITVPGGSRSFTLDFSFSEDRNTLLLDNEHRNIVGGETLSFSRLAKVEADDLSVLGDPLSGPFLVSKSSNEHVTFSALEDFDLDQIIHLKTLHGDQSFWVYISSSEIETLEWLSTEEIVSFNLRQIASHAQQYLLRTGSQEVDYAKLIEEGYLAGDLTAFFGERYESIKVGIDDTQISTRTADGRIITFDF